MIKSLLLWHKRLALMAALPFIVWALSGLIHPFMSHFTKAERLAPLPVVIAQENVKGALPIRQVLEKNGIGSLRYVTLITHNANTYYQIIQNTAFGQKTRYFDVLTGELSTQLNDAIYAQYLAEMWSGKESLSVTRLTHFTEAYSKINRILPVYRVQLSDHNLLYIDTLGKRIVAHNTPLRESLSYWFRVLHTFSFIGDTHDMKRILPMLMISTSLLLMALFGLIAYWLLWPKINTKRYSAQRLHRSLGLTLSVCLLGFSSSSTHMLIDKFYPETFREIVPEHTLTTTLINHDPLASLTQAKGDNVSLVNIDGQMISQIVHYHQRKPHFSYWQQQQISVNDLDVATNILSQQTGIHGNVANWQTIEKFGPTYGFVNKRLPVVQFMFTDNPTRYSVEVHTGFISAIDTRWQQVRSWHFGYLHKYHFLNPLGKAVRDSLLTIICLSLVTVAGLGIWLFLSRRKRRIAGIKRRASSSPIQFSK